MKKSVILAVLFSVVFLFGCEGWRQKGKPVVKTVQDIAGDLCDLIANEQVSVDPKVLGGLSIEEYCGIAENVTNVLDVIFSAKQEATAKLGLKPPEK